jgi:DUF438 domain-containing protein
MLPHVTPNPTPALLAELPAEHLLRDLVDEHDQILARLDRLDELLEDYRDAAGTFESTAIAAEIQSLTKDLLEAEPHHQREELVLFPELERSGIAGPPRMMTREHEELRGWKRTLLAAASEPHPDTEAVAEAIGSLAGMLRDHIAKENQILYPMALRSIDPNRWSLLRAAAKKLGPCKWREREI